MITHRLGVDIEALITDVLTRWLHEISPYAFQQHKLVATRSESPDRMSPSASA